MEVDGEASSSQESPKTKMDVTHEQAEGAVAEAEAAQKLPLTLSELLALGTVSICNFHISDGENGLSFMTAAILPAIKKPITIHPPFMRKKAARTKQRSISALHRSLYVKGKPKLESRLRGEYHSWDWLGRGETQRSYPFS